MKTLLFFTGYTATWFFAGIVLQVIVTLID
jgi:hypothetical protein